MMTMVISGSDGVTFPDSTNQFSGGAFSFKNRIINGDMRISQRNGTANTALTTNAYMVDRFLANSVGSSDYQQNKGSVTPPSGFTNYLGIAATGSNSGSGVTYAVRQNIEGNNIADLGFGTANAKTITLSFWVRSNITGTYTVAFRSETGRSRLETYAISSANTWEYKTITIPGDTSGTWNTNTSTGLAVWFCYGGDGNTGTAGSWQTADLRQVSGQANAIATTNDYFYITGVQLEVGSVATPFERRPFGAELALCQRYCQMIKGSGSFTKYGLGVCTSTTNLRGVVHLPVSMRTAPSLTTTSTASNYGVYTSSDIACSAVPTLNAQGTEVLANIDFTVASGLTTGNAALMQANNNTSAYLLLTAEL